MRKLLSGFLLLLVSSSPLLAQPVNPPDWNNPPAFTEGREILSTGLYNARAPYHAQDLDRLYAVDLTEHKVKIFDLRSESALASIPLQENSYTTCLQSTQYVNKTVLSKDHRQLGFSTQSYQGALCVVSVNLSSGVAKSMQLDNYPVSQGYTFISGLDFDSSGQLLIGLGATDWSGNPGYKPSKLLRYVSASDQIEELGLYWPDNSFGFQTDSTGGTLWSTLQSALLKFDLLSPTSPTNPQYISTFSQVSSNPDSAPLVLLEDQGAVAYRLYSYDYYNHSSTQTIEIRNVSSNQMTYPPRPEILYSVRFPANTYISAFTTSTDGRSIFASRCEGSDNFVYMLDTQTGSIVARFRTSSCAYQLYLTKNNNKLYAQNSWNGGSFTAFDVENLSCLSPSVKTDLERRLNDAELSISALSTQLQTSQVQVLSLTEAKTVLEQQLATAQNDVLSLNASLTAAQTQLQTLSQENTGLSAALSLAQDQVTRLSTQLQNANTQVADLKLQLTDTQNKLRDATSQLTVVSNALRQANAEKALLQAKLTAVSAQNVKLSAKVDCFTLAAKLPLGLIKSALERCARMN